MPQKKKVVRPQSPNMPNNLKETSVQEINIEDESFIQGILCTGGKIEHEQSEFIYIRESHFKEVSFKGSKFHRLDLKDVLFENCDFSNVDFTDAIIHKTIFNNCKMIGANLSNATFMNVMLYNCHSKYANYRFAQLKKSIFEMTNFESSDFQNAVLNEVQLLKSNFRESQFSGSCLNNIDFRTCDIDGMGFRIEDVKGVIMSAYQAVAVAKVAGVIIEDN